MPDTSVANLLRADSSTLPLLTLYLVETYSYRKLAVPILHSSVTFVFCVNFAAIMNLHNAMVNISPCMRIQRYMYSDVVCYK